MDLDEMKNESHNKAEEHPAQAESNTQDVPLVEKISDSEAEKQQQEKCEDSKKEEEDTSTVELTTEPFGEGEDCGVGSSDLNVRKDIQAVVDGVKRRRSTFGRGCISSKSMERRHSMCSGVPLLSLEDQISIIDKKLPWASILGKLIDISLKETCKRMEAQYPEDECVQDLKVDLLTQSETLGMELAFELSGRPLEFSPLPEALPSDMTCQSNNTMIAAYKKKTKDLEQEYKEWKILMKERKRVCRAAEGEYREAKAGMMKIYEDQSSSLMSAHRTLLASRPDYQQYLHELQTVREKAVLMLSKVKHTTVAVSRLLTASKIQAERSYNAVEAESCVHLKNDPMKFLLTSQSATDTQSAAANNCE